MFSVEQNYSRLFRPWDVSDSKKVEDQMKSDNANKLQKDTKAKRRKLDENKRENRLRKIRGTFRKPETNLHQDATVSTTTEDGDDRRPKFPTISETRPETNQSPVASLSLCCDRLLGPEQNQDKQLEKRQPKTETKPKGIDVKTPSTAETPFAVPQNVIAPHQNLYTAPFIPEYLHTDIAQALGVPATDPLLLESLAQGYAMELEYARILQQENEAKLLNARKQRPKKYKCPHCHVGFSNNGQLKGHIRIHTGERPFKCDEKNCGKTFTRNEELTRHKRIHSGVRPYPCPTCGKKFGRRDHLKKHTRTHFLQAERMTPIFVPLSAMPHVGGYPYLYGY